MRCLQIVILAVAIAPWAQAQAPPGSAGMIQGMVVDVQSSEPISGARVSIGGGRRTISDRAGLFRFQQVPPGQYLVNVEADDFRVAGVLPSVDVLAGQTIEGVKLELRRTATISGRVFDENGEPVANAQPELLQWQEAPTGRWTLTPLLIGSVETNDRGEYRIIGLDTGDYFIRINPPASRDRYPSTFYPNTNDSASAARITIAGGGETTGIDVRLAPTGVRVRGRFVLPQDTDPPTRVALVQRDAAVPVSTTLQSNAGETFAINGVPPGSYYLYAISSLRPVLNSPSPSMEWVRMPLEVGAEDIDGMVFAVAPAGSIQGRVYFATSARDIDRFDFTKLSLGLSYVDDGPPLSLPLQISGSGQFQLRRVSEGRIFVRQSSLENGWFVSAVRLNGNDVLASGFSVTPGREEILEIEISNSSGAISGSSRIVMENPSQPDATFLRQILHYVLIRHRFERELPAEKVNSQSNLWHRANTR